MYLTTNYLDMEEKLASAQAGIKNLSIENASLKESVAKSIKMGKQLKTAQTDLIIEKTLSAQKDDHLEKAKKEVEEAVRNFKAFDEYSNKMMVEYADGFGLLQRDLIKHHPNLNFASLNIKEIEKEMVAMKATPVSVAIVLAKVEVRSVKGDAGSIVLVAGDANVEQAYIFYFLRLTYFLSEEKTFSVFWTQMFWA